MKKHGAKVTKQSSSTPYAFRYEFDFKGDLTDLATEIETVEKTEILSSDEIDESLDNSYI